MALNILCILKEFMDFHIFSRLFIFLQNQPLLQDVKEEESKKTENHLNKVISMS